MGSLFSREGAQETDSPEVASKYMDGSCKMNDNSERVKGTASGELMVHISLQTPGYCIALSLLGDCLTGERSFHWYVFCVLFCHLTHH